MIRCLLFPFLIMQLAVGRQLDNPPDFLVRIWRSEDGLPGNVVRSLGQSPDGSLWVATAEGICRFDGYEFSGIATDSTRRGLESDPFRVFTPEDGSVWISTFQSGLYRIVGDRIEEIRLDPERVGTGIVTRLFTHRGIPCFHFNDRMWQLIGDEPVELVDPMPDLTRAIEDNLGRQTRRGRSEMHSVAPTRLIDRRGGEWRIEGGSLFYHPPGDGMPATRIPELGSDLVASDMLEDREGNLWIASPVRGLVRVRPRRVNMLKSGDGIYDHAASTALCSPDGTWWIANRNGGVDRIRDGALGHIPVLSSGGQRLVSCIFEDSKRRLWIASREGSVYELDRAKQEAVARFPRVPELSKINSIVEDDKGRLWFAGTRGICRWDGTEVETFAGVPALAGVQFESLTNGPGGGLLAGTLDGRVMAIRDDRFEFLSTAADLHMSRVSSVEAADQDEIWASTIGAGLFVRKDGRWHRFGTAEGIPDERLTGLALVGDDEIWMGSLKGIVRASRSELLARARDRTRVVRWLRLDRSDGMPTRECIGGGHPGVIRDLDGNLWFPTLAGLAGVDPAKVPADSLPPLLRMEPVRVNGVARPIAEEPLSVGPGRVRLSFRFAGIDLTAPEKVTYQAQLVGLDDALRFIGDKREVDYQLVPPGRYTFRVSATSGDGILSLPAVLPIEVRPHFWQTSWFIALAVLTSVLVAVAIGWLAARRRMRRRIEELRVRGLLEAERSRISRDLHDDLGASLTALSIHSELAAENPDDATLRPSLDRLSVRAKHVVGTLDEIVWATSPEQDSLRSLVEYLAFFAREFLKVVNVRLHTDIIRNVPDVSIGPRRRHNIALATREAINNAVKHAAAESISLRIAIEDGQLVVRVRDDGKGFDLEAASAGDGLKNLEKRMTDCGGACQFESEPGKGTTVTLSLPLPSH